MTLEEKEILRTKRVLEYAEACGNVLKTCGMRSAEEREFRRAVHALLTETRREIEKV